MLMFMKCKCKCGSQTPGVLQQLLRSQQRMKAQADKNRTEREFQEGDLVFLKLQPYVQSSIASRTHQKLSFRFYGPFKILQRIGKVAYKLDLPAEAKIHPVVHVSQLKKHVPEVVVVMTLVCTDPLQSIAPECILQERTIRRGSSMVHQKLVQWTGLPKTMVTWEDTLSSIEAISKVSSLRTSYV